MSARIESGWVHDGTFELRLSNLAANQHYLIESSYVMKAGCWFPGRSFAARHPDSEWSPSRGKDINVVFYRIRQGAY